MHDIIREKFIKLIKEHGLEGEEVIIRAAALSTEQAIGNPEDKDYPLVRGEERLMQAEFRGALGQAFTDMYGDFTGQLSEIAEMDLNNNFRRAVFISSLNAVMNHLGLIKQTVHCKDKQPRECATELASYIKENYGQPKIAMVGFQPRMVEALAQQFEIRVTDMDQENIGQEKFGVKIDDPSRTKENLEWCDIALVTGTTIVNDTIDQFLIAKPVVFYGVTIAGAAELQGWNRFCPFGG
ncbi:MAG: hypothetical protein A2Z76_01435 [Chloroflexi bacterium RBG_13_56_8b]|nr:MAG: hypothetical protein A2Z76_01435 [Chloroflexi bacterium RBG_13_56_8b]